MVHLEVRNKPPALHGKELTFRNVECLAFDYNENKKELAIFENYQQWADNTPGYTFCYIIGITYWDDAQEVTHG